MIKIFHTADVHIGLEFKNYTSKDLLKTQRIQVVANMIDLANQKQADLFIVAGDLFDKMSLKSEDIQATVNHLKNFKGKAVIVLPGNHDFANPESTLWKNFQRFADNSPVNILIPQKTEPIDLQEFGLSAIAYPAPCDSKHSQTHRIGWISSIPKDPALYHIGIAHGTIEGVALDDRNQYFKMNPVELYSAGVDIWLIGHAHVPWPSSLGNNEKIFNPGTPEPEEITRSHPGHAFFHEIDGLKNIKTELVQTGLYHFQRLEVILTNANDIEQLKTLADSKKVLDLTILGKLSKEDHTKLLSTLQWLREKTLDFFIENKCTVKLDQTTILSLFPDQSFPHLILTDLQDNETALQLAYEIIQECK